MEAASSQARRLQEEWPPTRRTASRSNLGEPLGTDGAGVVIDLGAGVDQRWLGERVLLRPWIGCGCCADCRVGHERRCSEGELLGRDRPGTWAEECCVPVRALVQIPVAWSSAAAAATAVPAAFAHRALEVAKVHEGDVVVVLDTQDPLAIALVESAIHRRVRVLCEAPDALVQQEMSTRGVENCWIAGSAPASHEVVRSTGPRGAGALFSVRQCPDAALLHSLRPGGCVVMARALPLEAQPILRRWGSVHCVLLGSPRDESRSLLEWQRRGSLVPVQVLVTLDQIDRAQRAWKSPHRFGELIVTPAATGQPNIERNVP